MKVVFKKLLTDKTDNKEVIKQYKVKSKKTAKDNSTKWKQKTLPDFNPEVIDTYYPEIWEMFPE